MIYYPIMNTLSTKKYNQNQLAQIKNLFQNTVEKDPKSWLLKCQDHKNPTVDI